MTYIVTIAAAKGGVGKSFIATHLAYEASRTRKTLLIDKDISNKTAEHILDKIDSSIDVVTNTQNPQNLDEGYFYYPNGQRIKSSDPKFLERYDLIFIDEPAGSTESVYKDCKNSNLVLLATTAEPLVIDSFKKFHQQMKIYGVDVGILPIISKHRKNYSAYKKGLEELRQYFPEPLIESLEPYIIPDRANAVDGSLQTISKWNGGTIPKQVSDICTPVLNIYSILEKILEQTERPLNTMQNIANGLYTPIEPEKVSFLKKLFFLS